MSIVVVVTAFPIPEHRAEMIEKYESEQARSEHLTGAALADLRSALEGTLSSSLDAQVLVPHPAGNAQKGAL
jgi:quinol monooxygenase YgiN